MTNPVSHGPGFPPNSFDFLYKYEDNHFWFQSRNDLIGWAFKKFLRTRETFLEMGCGNGCVLSRLKRSFPETSFFGTDLFLEGLLHAKGRLGDTTLVQMDVEQPAFGTTFDAIGIFDVLEHLDDDESALRNIYKLLNGGGVAMITVPQHQWLWSATDDFAYHKRRYSRQQLSTKLLQTGFEVTFISSFMTFILPLMMASRFIRRFKSSKAVLDEFEIPNLLNKLLYRICVAEQWLIEDGLSLPTGGSLLAVARKEN